MTARLAWRRSTLVAEVRSGPCRIALLQLDAAQPVVLEGTAATIWELIDGERNEQAILAELEARFEDANDHMQAQVADFLANLQDQHLIEAAGS
ncbi:PqqD family protein [Pseudarthrobacter sp. IC2-21]|uniref:PqqD family protein n=1 Tax=Pseudarthrobacter sp. IC2-21 TaxID=3092262 RepID=UPI002A6B2EAE|nr:PqqD family protein [Pseudarthrobacter sp. IC2-21]